MATFGHGPMHIHKVPAADHVPQGRLVACSPGASSTFFLLTEDCGPRMVLDLLYT